MTVAILSFRSKLPVVLQKSIRSALEFLPLWAYRPVLRRCVSGFFLHDVSESPDPIVRNLFRAPRPEEFAAILEFLTSRFNFVPLDDVVHHYRCGDRLPDNAAFFSVDDGYKSCRHTIAPMLMQAGVPATFFLATAAINNADLFSGHKRSLIIDVLRRNCGGDDLVPFLPLGARDVQEVPVRQVLESLQRFPIHTAEARATLDRLAVDLGIDWQRYLNESRPFMEDDDIRWLLAQGFDIGAHSVDHTKFQFLDSAARERQVKLSVDLLCDRFDLEHVAFSFPNSAAQVSRDWMREQLAANPRLSIFVNTARYRQNDSVMVNRLTLDQPADWEGKESDLGPQGVAEAIRKSLARDLFRK